MMMREDRTPPMVAVRIGALAPSMARVVGGQAVGCWTTRSSTPAAGSMPRLVGGQAVGVRS